MEWVFEGNDKISSDLDVSPRTFSALTFTTPHLKLKSRNYELLQYKATDEHTEGVQLFTITQASGGNTGEDAKGTTTVTSVNTNNPAKIKDFPYLLRSIIVSVVLAEPLLSTVTVNMWTKSKGA